MQDISIIKIQRFNESWIKVMDKFRQFPEYKLVKDICNKILRGEKIYPMYPFEVLSHIDVPQVKVIIIGQDPYHTPCVANGIAFSVNKKDKLPPSLANIFEELRNEYPDIELNHGYLLDWVKQGVLLLNTVLTVEEGVPGSHEDMGWEIYTRLIIDEVLRENPEVIIVAWGKKALQHLNGLTIKNLLTSPHPSPFSARLGFFGNDHFKEINSILKEQGKKEIEWAIRR